MDALSSIFLLLIISSCICSRIFALIHNLHLSCPLNRQWKAELLYSDPAQAYQVRLFAADSELHPQRLTFQPNSHNQTVNWPYEHLPNVAEVIG